MTAQSITLPLEGTKAPSALRYYHLKNLRPNDAGRGSLRAMKAPAPIAGAGCTNLHQFPRRYRLVSRARCTCTEQASRAASALSLLILLAALS